MMDDNPVVKYCHTHGALTRAQCNSNGKHPSGNQAYRCKQCLSVSHHKYYEKNKDDVNAKHLQYKINNYEKVLAGKRASYRKNRAYYPKRPKYMDERYSESTYQFDHEGRLLLEDWYVRELIAKNHGCRSGEIPQEVVDLKREVIKIKRFIRSKNLNIPLEELLPNETIITRNKDENSSS